MLISKISYKNDKILGDLDLSFSDQNGKIYKTIILAGENGTGKTRIMDTLFDFLNLGPITPFKNIEYIASDNESYSVFYDEDDLYNIGFHKRKSLDNPNNIEEIRRNRSNSTNVIEQDIADIRYYGVAYLSARSIFNTSQVSSTTTLQLDTQKRIDDRKEDYTNIKQLLVNLSTQDNAMLSKLLNDSNNDNLKTSELRLKYETEYSKLQRFRKAFDSFFDNGLVFDTIDVEDTNEINIYFKKGNKKIKIDDLSSGEKQIVFRGAKLLGDASLINKGLIMVDEPELNLHPIWQNKILKYYHDLFSNVNDERPQMIIATHSEYVISHALKDPENTLVVVLRNNNKEIIADAASTASDKFVLSNLSASEISYLAFNLPTVDYHIGLYGRLHDILNNSRIKDTDLQIKEYIEYNYQGSEKDKLLRTWRFGNTTCETLSTYIRNAIDHPEGIADQEIKNYNDEDLRNSVELLRRILLDHDNKAQE